MLSVAKATLESLLSSEGVVMWNLRCGYVQKGVVMCLSSIAKTDLTATCLSAIMPISHHAHRLSCPSAISHHAHQPLYPSTIKPISHCTHQPSCPSTIMPIDHYAYRPSGLLLRLLSLSACFRSSSSTNQYNRKQMIPKIFAPILNWHFNTNVLQKLDVWCIKNTCLAI